MTKELIILEEPKIPTRWNYEESVKKVKVLVYKWKNLTEEVANELFIARSILSRKQSYVANATFTWEGYCEEIGADRSTIHRWINRYFVANATRLELPTPELPEGKYQVIYADPPFDYGKPQHGKEGTEDTGGAHTHYSVMKDEEIEKMNVAKIADENCLLFIWVGAPKMKAAILIGEAWGFEYSTVGFVWYKEKPNPGSYTMSECEFCLIFKKGVIPEPRGDRNIRQFLAEKRTEHSKKPDEIRRRIELMFPTQKKIEMFARQRTIGWDVVGNEIDKYDSRRNK